MSTGMILVIMLGMMMLCIFTVFALIMGSSKNPRTANSHLAKRAKQYQFFSENFLTRRSFRKLVEQVASLSVYNLQEIRELSIKYYTRTIVFSGAFVVGGIVVFRDLTATLLCCCLAMIVYNSTINKRVNATHFQVLKEFNEALGSIRETYTLRGNIPDAVGECRKGRLLSNPLERIYLILTATDAEERLEDYYRTVPFPMLQTLAGVCYLLNDAGDERDDSGVSAFKSAITLLKRECEMEIRKLTKQNIMYKRLDILPLAPLPLIGILQWFFSTQMPGTAVYYNGILGYVAKVVLILLAMAAYWYITTNTDNDAIRRNDRSNIIDFFVHWRPIKPLIDNMLPKKKATRDKISRLLKGALSSKDIRYIYTSKILVSVITFVLTLFALTVFTFLAREFAYTNVRPPSFIGAADMTVEEEESWRTIDNYILDRDFPPNERELQDLIPNYFPDITPMDLNDQISRIESKYRTYHNLSFHWWYVLVAYAAAFIAWTLPAYMIKIRKRLVHAEEQEDVLQLQTILAILRYTSLDTMSALYWLARQSRVYQIPLYFAYHEYASDPEQAIARLQEQSSLPEFKQICERLLTTISQVTIREAFSDLEAERDQVLSLREMVQTDTITKRRAACSPLSKAPLIATIVLMVVVPIFYLVVNEGISVIKQLGVM